MCTGIMAAARPTVVETSDRPCSATGKGKSIKTQETEAAVTSFLIIHLDILYPNKDHFLILFSMQGDLSVQEGLGSVISFMSLMLSRKQSLGTLLNSI